MLCCLLFFLVICVFIVLLVRAYFVFRSSSRAFVICLFQNVLTYLHLSCCAGHFESNTASVSSAPERADDKTIQPDTCSWRDVDHKQSVVVHSCVDIEQWIDGSVRIRVYCLGLGLLYSLCEIYTFSYIYIYLYIFFINRCPLKLFIYNIVVVDPYHFLCQISLYLLFTSLILS